MEMINVFNLKGLEKVAFYLDDNNYVEATLSDIDTCKFTKEGDYLDVHVVDRGTLKTNGNGLEEESPCQKLNQSNIKAIALEFEGNIFETYPVIWTNSDKNEYQRNKLYSYKAISITIKVENAKIDFDDVLMFREGTVLKRKSNDQEVRVVLLDNEKFLISVDTNEVVPFSSSLLTEEFELVR